MNEILFRNVMLYDGSADPSFEADVAVKEDKIVQVAPGGTLSGSGAQIVEGKGFAMTPGFVDVHTHSDRTIFDTPAADSFISQGTTTDISGNCGFSGYLTNKEITSFAQYADRIDTLKPALNMAGLCGHNSLRIRVMGYENRKPTLEELASMKKLLAEALREGACGFSSGLFYLPGNFAGTEELCALASLLKGTSKPYCTHMRSEGATLVESVEEAIRIAKEGDNSLQISHLKTSGPAYWNKLDDVFERIETAQREGMDLLCDRYAYIHSGTTLRVILPPPYDKVDTDALCARLKEDASYRQELVQTLLEKGSLRDLSRTLLVNSPVKEHEKYYGMSIAQIAQQKGISPEEEVVEILSSGASPHCAFGTMCEENLHRILAKPYVLCGSDGYAIGKDNAGAHPRSFGNAPNFFRTASKFNSAEQVIRRMTALPARKFNLAGRGMVREGFYADLVLLDMDRFESRASYAKPNVLASGVKKVYVNGVLSYDCDPERKVTPCAGRFLRVL